jgi:DnaJ-class molecular chaperone
MSTGPGGTTFTTGPGGSNVGGIPFNIHTSGRGNGSNRRRWASAFGGEDSDEEMFTAGAPGTNPFAAYSMGPNGFFQQQQQHPASGGWGGSSAGGRFSGYGQQHQQQQPLPQQVALPLTLEELYSGCTKRLKVGALLSGCLPAMAGTAQES